MVEIYESDFGTVRLKYIPLKVWSPRFKRSITFGDHKHTTAASTEKCSSCRAESGLSDFLMFIFQAGGSIKEIIGDPHMEALNEHKASEKA